jgi:hypothetical protein
LSCRTLGIVWGSFTPKTHRYPGDAGEGDLTAGERLAICRCHANEDAVAPEAVIDLVHRTGQFFRFTASRQIGVWRAPEELRLQIG